MIETFEFVIQLPTQITMPKFPGSMLRGAFGHALREIACMTKQKTCNDCPLTANCSYARVFEVQQIPSSFKALSPYIIQPGEDINAGKKPRPYHFTMTLIGEDTLKQLPIILLAWQKAFNKGLGKDAFIPTIHKVSHVRTQKDVYRKGTILPFDYKPSELPYPPVQNKPWCIEFRTPMRIERQGKLIGQREFTLFELFKALVRRNKNIAKNYFNNWQNEYIELDSLRFIQCEAKLKWQDWSRYSNRQRQKMQLGGLVGTLTIPANTLTPQQAYQLSLSEKLNIGKHTVFGMGAIRITKDSNH